MFNTKSLDNLSAALNALKATFNESDHPRVPEGQSDGGEFTSGDGGDDEPVIIITGEWKPLSKKYLD
jgi:hypothetical protein